MPSACEQARARQLFARFHALARRAASRRVTTLVGSRRSNWRPDLGFGLSGTVTELHADPAGNQRGEQELELIVRHEPTSEHSGLGRLFGMALAAAAAIGVIAMLPDIKRYIRISTM